MPSNLLGPPKAVCYREGSTVVGVFIRRSSVYVLYLMHGGQSEHTTTIVAVGTWKKND